MGKSIKHASKNKLKSIDKQKEHTKDNFNAISFRKRENLRVLNAENFVEIPHCSHGKCFKNFHILINHI